MRTKQSRAFNLLDEKVRRWICRQGWHKLRDIQEEAVPAILQAKCDVIISSATASGKTEAAFLPICSDLVGRRESPGSVLYISPLKALINDQFDRLFDLCKTLEIPVYPWHGDISPGKKKGFFNTRRGIVLITPESLEAMFVNNGCRIGSVFEYLRYVVIDELHAFIGDERGRQLQSLLRRTEAHLGRKVSRVGLSATLGAPDVAARFIRPRAGEDVRMIVSHSNDQKLRLELRGFVLKGPSAEEEKTSERPVNAEEKCRRKSEKRSDSTPETVSRTLFTELRGTSNLVFANSRRDVELYADNLRTCCELARLPCEFFPHHGSLHKSIREEAEAAIKDKSTPRTILCTSTLEMGIDIGAVDSVAQVGVPPSVSSLRQRLGRSGRRGNAAVLRVLIEQNKLSSGSRPLELLRNETFQGIAMVNLMLSKWYEPPDDKRLHLSTMVQQIMSLVAERSGITALHAWQILVSEGPFSAVTQQQFIELLRHMAHKGLLMQAADGLLLLGPTGERKVNHFEFYAVFLTPKEYRLTAGGKTIGTLPILRRLKEGAVLIFAGLRWSILSVNDKKRVIDLEPASEGAPPKFGGEAGEVHDRVREEMLRLYLSDNEFIYLDNTAKTFLSEGRESFRYLGLGERSILPWEENTYLFPWAGDKTGDTIALILNSRGLKTENLGLALKVKADQDKVFATLKEIANGPSPRPEELAEIVKNKIKQKYDYYLPRTLLVAEYAAANLDVKNARIAIQRLVSEVTPAAVAKLSQKEGDRLMQSSAFQLERQLLERQPGVSI